MNFFLCTTPDNTTQNIFYKIKFSYLCTPIDKTTQKNFYKIKFSYLCTPIDIVYFFLFDFLVRPRLLASNSSIYTTKVPLSIFSL